MRKRSLIFALSLFFLIGAAGYAADTSLNVNPKKVNMGIVTASDYEAGFMENIRANFLLIKDKNNDWKVTIRTNDDNMGVVGSYAKPISDLEWKAVGDHATQLTYAGLTTYDIEVGRGPSANEEQKIFVDYRVLLSWANDIPGDYFLTILYTLTTQ